MLTERPYSAKLTVREVVAELRRCAGTQFDPKVASTLAAILAETIEVEETETQREGMPHLGLLPRRHAPT